MNTEENSPSTDDLYQWWWSHDAAWYQTVNARYGADAANEANRDAMRLAARRVARSVRRTLPKPIEEHSWPEVVAAYERCPAMMWPSEMIRFEYDVTAPGEFEVRVTYNFALQMLRKANSLEEYDCPCLAMREGWFDGLGLPDGKTEIVCCQRKGAETCTFVGTVADRRATPAPEDTEGRGHGSERRDSTTTSRY